MQVEANAETTNLIQDLRGLVPRITDTIVLRQEDTDLREINFKTNVQRIRKSQESQETFNRKEKSKYFVKISRLKGLQLVFERYNKKINNV